MKLFIIWDPGCCGDPRSIKEIHTNNRTAEKRFSMIYGREPMRDIYKNIDEENWEEMETYES